MSGKRKLSSLLKISGIILMFYIVINFYFFVAVAMSNGGAVTVYFNKLNEGLLECVIYVMALPLIVFSFILEVRTYVNERWKKNE